MKNHLLKTQIFCCGFQPKYVLLFFLLFYLNDGLAQIIYNPSIHFGMSTDSVEHIVGNEVQTHFNAGAYLTQVSAETIDYQDSQRDIILRKTNLIVGFLDQSINCNIHFIMVDNRLAKIKIQYQNLSISDVKRILLAEQKVNISNYYFDSGYHFFSRLYSAEDGAIWEEYQPTVFKLLPYTIQEELKMLLSDVKIP